MKSPVATVAACLALLVVCLMTMGSSEQPHHYAVIRGGFFTGNEYRDLSHDEKLAYVSGVFDGYTNATLLGAPDTNSQALLDCLPKLRQDQLEAIVSKYLADNPEKWGFPMSLLVYNSLPSACRNK